jgi:glutathionyl-hydroquinone reductase
LGRFSWGVSGRPRLRRIADYPNLWGYLKDLYQQPALAETVERDQIRAATTLETRVPTPRA